MEPRWTRVGSSILEAVAYDPAERRLLIRFGTGAIYEFGDVPAVVYEEMLAASSKGGYFSEYVRPDYPYRRVRGAGAGIPAPAR